MGIWAVMTGWRFDAVEVVMETEQTVLYLETYRGGGGRETRANKTSFLDWRGTEEGARRLVEKLTSAEAEYARRRNAASAWFACRKAEIIAQGTDARRAETVEPGSVHDGPVAESDAPTPTPEGQ